MTTKEIAEAVGKDERSVQRWVKSLADKMSSVSDKLSVSSPNNPARWSLDEVCSIIQIGLGDSAASLFRENALRDIPAPSPKRPKIKKDALPSHYQMARMIEMYGRDEAARRCDFLIGYSRQYTKPTALIEEPIGPLPDFGEFFTKAVEKAHNGEKNGND